MSGETNDEKSQRVQDQHPGQGSLSGEYEIDEKKPDEKQDPGNKVLSGEFRWMRRRHRPDLEEGADSITTSSTDDNSRNSGIDTYSDRNSGSGSELSELAIHTLLVETRARDLDREMVWKQRSGWFGNNSGMETFDKSIATKRGSQD